MAAKMLLLVLFAVAYGYPSGHLEHIEIPDYEPKLEFLGQHVELPEVPTKIIRITKTVAIKVPVPYPVKIPHSVPYPVHVNKPYPVPVPQIIKVPQPVPVPIVATGHQLQIGHLDNSLDGNSGGHYPASLHSYHVEEGNHDTTGIDGLGKVDHEGGEQYGESKQVNTNAMAYVNQAQYQQQQEAAGTQQSPQIYQQITQDVNQQGYAMPANQDVKRVDYRIQRQATDPQNYQNYRNYQNQNRQYYIRVPVQASRG